MGDLVLALDVATRTGWALLGTDGRLHAWGSFLCSPTKKLCRWSRYRQGLTSIVSPELVDRVAVVVFEKPITYGARGRSAAAARVLFGLISHTEHWASARGIETSEVAPATAKRVVAGNGRASKYDVARAVSSRFPGRGLGELVHAGPYDATDAVAVGLTWIHIAA